MFFRIASRLTLSNWFMGYEISCECLSSSYGKGFMYSSYI